MTKRFIEYITKEPDRFLPYAFEENPRIKTFENLEDAFRKVFKNSTESDNTTSAELIELWNTKECRKRVRENTTDKEFEEAYGDGIKVIYTARDRKVTRIEIPKIKSTGYSRRGKTITGYSRTKPRKYTPVETRFIKVRRQRKMSSKQIISDYNKHFSEKPRTESSIRTKMYRA